MVYAFISQLSVTSLINPRDTLVLRLWAIIYDIPVWGTDWLHTRKWEAMAHLVLQIQPHKVTPGIIALHASPFIFDMQQIMWINEMWQNNIKKNIKV